MSDDDDLKSLRSDFFSARVEGFDKAAQSVLMKEAPQQVVETQSPIALSSDGVFVDGSDLTDSRSLTLIPDRLINEVFREQFKDNLTDGELRLLKLSLCAKSLRKISDIEGVTYETRRTQMKRLLEKSGRSRQTEFLINMSSALVKALLAETGTNDEFCAPLRSYLGKFYQDDFRVFSYETRSGMKLLIGDYGPINGQPCIMLHSSVFTVFPLPHQSEVLNELGIRLLTPYRPGFFDVPIATRDQDAFEKDYLNGLTEFLEIFGLDTAPIISHAYGSNLALRLMGSTSAQQRAVICSPLNFTPELDKLLSPHVRAMFKLCARHPAFCRALMRTLYSTTKTTEQVSMVLKQYFGGSGEDMTRLNEELTRPSSYSLLMEAGKTSISGLVNDFALVQKSLDDIGSITNHDVVVVVGGQDFLTNPHEWEQMEALSGVQVECVEEFGRGTFMLEPKKLLSLAFPD